MEEDKREPTRLAACKLRGQHCELIRDMTQPLSSVPSSSSTNRRSQKEQNKYIMHVRRFDSCHRPPSVPNPRRRRWNGTNRVATGQGRCVADYVRRECESREGERKRGKGEKRDRPKQDEPTPAGAGGGREDRQTHCVGSNYRADGGPGGSSPSLTPPLSPSALRGFACRRGQRESEKWKGGVFPSPRQNLTQPISTPPSRPPPCKHQRQTERRWFADPVVEIRRGSLGHVEIMGP